MHVWFYILLVLALYGSVKTGHDARDGKWDSVILNGLTTIGSFILSGACLIASYIK